LLFCGSKSFAITKHAGKTLGENEFMQINSSHSFHFQGTSGLEFFASGNSSATFHDPGFYFPGTTMG
jgi:hypothetical protein